MSKATSAKPFRIFISHKHEDMEVAEDISRWLDQFYGDRVKVFLSKRIAAGVVWRCELRDALAKADVLILLYIGPHRPREQWDWCLYESYFFLGRKYPKGRLLVIHDRRVTTPEPLDQLPHCTIEKLKEVLPELIGPHRSAGQK